MQRPASAVHDGADMYNASLAATLLVLVTATAHAQQTGAPSPPTAPSERALTRVAITISPLHMIIPMAEVTAELRLAPRLGVAVIGGIGRVRSTVTNEPIDLFEGGASARYYLTGSFRSGLQIGAEALFVHASTEDMSVDIKARGLGLSPFVGYKWTHHSGFTLEGQLGASVMFLRAKSSSATVEDKRVAPMLNLNAGWSF